MNAHATQPHSILTLVPVTLGTLRMHSDYLPIVSIQSLCARLKFIKPHLSLQYVARLNGGLVVLAHTRAIANLAIGAIGPIRRQTPATA